MARWSSLALCLALCSASAAAQWSAVGSGDYIHSAYADKATLRRNGVMASLSVLYDFRRQDFTRGGKGLYSTVALREYDCNQRRARLLSSIDFAGQMGTGEVADTSARPGRWEEIVAGALDEKFWLIACKND